MIGILVTISPRRFALLEDDPGLIADVIAKRAEEPIAGLLELGSAWDALDRILGGDGDALMRDAILARGGGAVGPDLGRGPPRVISTEQVRRIASALTELPEDTVARRYGVVAGSEVFGGWGAREDRDGAIAELTALLGAVRELYDQAAGEGHGMLAVVVSA